MDGTPFMNSTARLACSRASMRARTAGSRDMAESLERADHGSAIARARPATRRCVAVAMASSAHGPPAPPAATPARLAAPAAGLAGAGGRGLVGLGPRRMRGEIVDAQRQLGAITGAAPRWFR